jgi:hypothetical protein
MSKSIGIKCPACGSRMRVNGVKQLNDLLKKVSATCPNAKCLCSATAHIEITKILHHSLIDVPEIADQTLPTNGVLL